MLKDALRWRLPDCPGWKRRPGPTAFLLSACFFSAMTEYPPTEEGKEPTQARWIDSCNTPVAAPARPLDLQRRRPERL
jgi:hypothetical protein